MKDPANKRYWQRVSGIYDRFVGKDAAAYERMYAFIRASLGKEMRVLELATGTGLVARAVADAAESVEATDFSPRMIERARAKPAVENLRFAVADACALEYPDASFDAVIIANALHIMPEPRRALAEIRRVLKDDGVLFAPTFTHAGLSPTAALKGALMMLSGFRPHAKWTAESYRSFLEDEGWTVGRVETVPAIFPLCCVEARKG